MSSNHFKYFGLQNFKRFKNIGIENIGQFNLILGDNNVGKTSLLEALTFDLNPSRFLAGLSYCLRLRGVNFNPHQGTIGSYLNVSATESGIPILTISISMGSTVKYDFHFDVSNEKVEFYTSLSGKKEEFLLHEFYEPKTIPFIPYSTGYSDNLVEVYSKEIANSAKKKRALVDNLKSLHSGIIDFELDPIDKQSIVCWLDGQDTPLPITSLGQGTLKTFVYLSEFVKNQNFQVMIDEIDAGIYYRRMKDYWKVILRSAMENDVQLFATTHNLECIESFELALKELGDEFTQRARTITLKENSKTKEVTAYTNEFSVLEHALELGNDLR